MNKKDLMLFLVVAVIIALAGIGIATLIINTKGNDEKTVEVNTTGSFSSKDKEDEEKKEEKEQEDKDKSEKEKDKGDDNMYKSGKHHATIVVKDYGTIKLELDADTAPITVANFAKLVNDGFYNGLTFHRIMKGFMMQGGDPLGNGTGGSDEEIKGEFSANGVKNDISHVRGVISMARATPYNSASSQFFIVHKDSSSSLDGLYAAFGKVTDGMDVVDKICETAKPIDNNGTIPASEQPVIESITMND